MSILDSLLEVKIAEEDDFLKIRETLTRIGVASKKDRKLYQSCHILHKQGRYYIVHFKELFALDGKPATIGSDDIARRNTIANLVAEWGLVTLVEPTKSSDPVAPLSQIKVLPYKEKDDWELVAKYNIGRR
jgi:Bacteriophage translational regulator